MTVTAVDTTCNLLANLVARYFTAVVMVGDSRQPVGLPEPHGRLQGSWVLRQPLRVTEQIAIAIAAILICLIIMILVVAK